MKFENTWWYSSTNEERIAQIEAGLQLGMTIPQIATNLRTSQKNIADFLRRFVITPEKSSVSIAEMLLVDKNKNKNNLKVPFAFDIFRDKMKWKYSYLEEIQ